MEGDVNPVEASTKTKTDSCTDAKCIEDNDELEKLKCSICSRKIHQKCSLLPPYQIARHLDFFKKNHVPYICSTCITITDDYDKRIYRNNQNKDENAEKDSLNVDIKFEMMVMEMEQKDKEIKELKERLLSLENNTISSKQKQKKKNINEDPMPHDQPTEQPEALAMKDQQIKILQDQNESLNKRLDERENKLDKAIQQLTGLDKTNNLNDKFAIEINKSIDNRINAMQSTIINLMETKLNEITKQNEDKFIAINNKQNVESSYATALGGKDGGRPDVSVTNNQFTPTVANFRSIMMSTKNEELAEQKDKEMRSRNIIIHGKQESEPQDDSDFVKNLIKDIGENVTPKVHVRIGKETENKKKRPIKVILDKLDDKERIMNNLRKLKDKDQYKGISITDDYTISERQIIKEFTTRAKERNQNEPEDSNYVWKVRGTPKNGLILKKLMKVKPNQASTEQ